MQWLEMPEGWEILSINKDNKTCYVFAGGRYYGSPIRIHNGEMYFSISDRCVWYQLKRNDEDVGGK